MSYDLSIFAQASVLADRDIGKIHAALCEGGRDAAIDRSPKSKRAVAATHAALVKRWPELADADDPDETPWAARIDRGTYHLVVPMSGSFVDDVLPEILAIAAKTGLDVFDPQTKTLHRPLDPRSKRVAIPTGHVRLKPAQIQAGLREGLTPAMATHGFAPSTDRLASFVAWERTPRKGLTQSIMLQTGYSPTASRLWIRVHLDEVAGVLAPDGPSSRTWPFAGPPDVVRCELLGFYRDADGGVKKHPWALRRLEYDVCHADCLAQAVPKLATDVEERALPALEALSTVRRLDAIYNEPGAIKLQYLQEYAQSRFVAVALATLAKRKDRANVVAAARAVVESAVKRGVARDAVKPVGKAFDALVKQLG